MGPYIILPKNGYFGGKGGAGVYQTIINQIPPHTRRWCFFLGKCAVMRYMKPAAINIGYDLDAELIAEWRNAEIIRTHPGQKFVWLDLDGIKALETYALLLDQSDFVYLDPPYRFDSRKSSKDRYKYELTDEQHNHLVKICSLLKCKVAISHYQDPLYDSLGWRTVDYQAQTRGGVVTDRLYLNYPEPDLLHDYDYLGDDFKEREHIRLKFNRWKKNFRALSAYEQDMRRTWMNKDVTDGR